MSTLPLLELGQVDVAGGDQLGLDVVALVLEQLLVDRGHHLALGEVLAADDDRALVAAAAVGAASGPRGRRRTQPAGEEQRGGERSRERCA